MDHATIEEIQAFVTEHRGQGHSPRMRGDGYVHCNCGEEIKSLHVID